MELTKNGAINYLKDYKFRLRDYAKTREKHGNYKVEKFDLIYKTLYENKVECEYLKESQIEYDLQNNYHVYEYITGMVKEHKNKTALIKLATHINHTTRNHLDYTIRWVASHYLDMELNDNEAKNFTIKLYLKDYMLINNTMSSILQEVALDLMYPNE